MSNSCSVRWGARELRAPLLEMRATRAGAPLPDEGQYARGAHKRFGGRPGRLRAPSAIHPRFRAATKLRRMLAVSRSAPRRRSAMRPSRLHRHASPPGCRLHPAALFVGARTRAAAAASVTLRRRGAGFHARRGGGSTPSDGARFAAGDALSATRPCRRPVVALPARHEHSNTRAASDPVVARALSARAVPSAELARGKAARRGVPVLFKAAGRRVSCPTSTLMMPISALRPRTCAPCGTARKERGHSRN